MSANQALVIDFSVVAPLEVTQHMEVEQEAPVVPVKTRKCSGKETAAKKGNAAKKVIASKATTRKCSGKETAAKKRNAAKKVIASKATVTKKAGDVKRVRNPYMHFMMLERSRFVEQYELDVTKPKVVAAKMAEVWRTMSTEEKAPFCELAAADKTRFQEQLANGMTTSTITYSRVRTGKDGALRAAKKRKGGMAARRTNPDMPKKPRLTYLIFVAAKRQEVEASLDSSLWENATGRQRGLAKNAAISKKTGEMWKAMSEEERAPYKIEADADRQRYEREMAVYLQKEAKEATCDAWSTIPEPQPMAVDEELYAERG